MISEIAHLFINTLIQYSTLILYFLRRYLGIIDDSVEIKKARDCPHIIKLVAVSDRHQESVTQVIQTMIMIWDAGSIPTLPNIP